MTRFGPLTMLLLSFACARSSPSHYTMEPWLKANDWPPLVLNHRVTFEDSTTLIGGSAFLARTDDGRVLAITAAHLLGARAGVFPPVEPQKLDENLKSWRMTTRAAPETVLEARGLAIRPPRTSRWDWLVLALKPYEGALPVEPLRLRRARVARGEHVVVPGCAEADDGCTQRIFRGVVAEHTGHRFRITFEEPVDLRGLAGAPVLDAHGLVVGLFLEGLFEDKRGRVREGAGEDPHDDVLAATEGP